jgi:hypothetical protein
METFIRIHPRKIFAKHPVFFLFLFGFKKKKEWASLKQDIYKYDPILFFCSPQELLIIQKESVAACPHRKISPQ